MIKVIKSRFAKYGIRHVNRLKETFKRCYLEVIKTYSGSLFHRAITRTGKADRHRSFPNTMQNCDIIRPGFTGERNTADSKST